MHILGAKLQSALTAPVVRLVYGLRFASQTALCWKSPRRVIAINATM